MVRVERCGVLKEFSLFEEMFWLVGVVCEGNWIKKNFGGLDWI